MKFKKTIITINGKKVHGYRVINPGKTFRGLKIFLTKRHQRWSAYEKTTGLYITPPSHPASFSTNTRKDTISMLANHLQGQSEEIWKKVQEQLNYPLKKEIQ